MLEVKTNHGAIEMSMEGHPIEICADVGIIINQVFNGIFQQDPCAGVAFRESLKMMINDDRTELFKFNYPNDEEGNKNGTE